MPESGHLLTRMNWCTKCVKEHNYVSNLKRKLLYIWCYLFTKLFVLDTILVSIYVHIYYTLESASI